MHETPGPPDHANRLARGAIQVPSRCQPNVGRRPDRIAETSPRPREQTLVQARDVANQRRGPTIASFPCARTFRAQADRKSDVAGKSVSVRVDLGGCRILKKKK